MWPSLRCITAKSIKFANCSFNNAQQQQRNNETVTVTTATASGDGLSSSSAEVAKIFLKYGSFFGNFMRSCAQLLNCKFILLTLIIAFESFETLSRIDSGRDPQMSTNLDVFTCLSRLQTPIKYQIIYLIFTMVGSLSFHKFDDLCEF